MGKHEVGTPKYIANKIKAKGLQKLRWYCQMVSCNQLILFMRIYLFLHALKKYLKTLIFLKIITIYFFYCFEKYIFNNFYSFVTYLNYNSIRSLWCIYFWCKIWQSQRKTILFLVQACEIPWYRFLKNDSNFESKCLSSSH